MLPGRAARRPRAANSLRHCPARPHTGALVCTLVTVRGAEPAAGVELQLHRGHVEGRTVHGVHRNDRAGGVHGAAARAVPRTADPVRKQRAQPLRVQPFFQGRGEFLDGKEPDAVFTHQPDHFRGVRLAFPGVEAHDRQFRRRGCGLCLPRALLPSRQRIRLPGQKPVRHPVRREQPEQLQGQEGAGREDRPGTPRRQREQEGRAAGSTNQGVKATSWTTGAGHGAGTARKTDTTATGAAQRARTRATGGWRCGASRVGPGRPGDGHGMSLCSRTAGVAPSRRSLPRLETQCHRLSPHRGSETQYFLRYHRRSSFDPAITGELPEEHPRGRWRLSRTRTQRPVEPDG